ncbi:MAG TPA: glycoside hydrolase domain-containing protein, partial [bacterium]|nr:glycoside hydrolase domain-containing protein [bacterium]
NQLDKLFTTSDKLTGKEQADITGLIGQYAHGNEPSHHMAYLYSYADKEWQTQSVLRKIMTEFYTNQVDGLAGNEDCGQMSAWYIFSSMGFYPVTPGSDYYVIGAPMFKKVRIPLYNGNTVLISAENLSNKNKYIEELYINNEPWKKSYINHKTLMEGCEIRFIMTDQPNKAWFEKDELLAKSNIAEGITPVPYFQYDGINFQDTNRIKLECIDKDADIYYTTNGQNPTKDAQLYQKPFIIDKSCQVVARAFAPGKSPSKTAKAEFVKTPYAWDIKLNTDYSAKYAAGGRDALINTVLGSSNYWTGEWQGYEKVDLDAVIDLKEVRELEKVSIRFLQSIGSWIFMPEKVEFLFSANGKDYKKAEVIDNQIPARKAGTIIEKFSTDLKGQKARYIRVRAKNRGLCPSWHKGAGRPAWIFADEILISIND